MGIVGGLYKNIVPFIFAFLVLIIAFLKNIKINNKFVRILKVFIKNNIILIFVVSAFTASLYLNICNNKYEKVYKNFSAKEIIATVISNEKELEYVSTYKVKLENKISLLLKVPKKIKTNLNYGDKIIINGEYSVPEQARNYGGFNYREYLKTQKIYGIFEAKSITIIDCNNLNGIDIFSNNLKKKIIDKSNNILPKSTRNLFLGILIGFDDNLEEDIQESFRKCNLMHLLAVSGAHIAYIIFGINFVFCKLKVNKQIRYLIIMIFLVIFTYITDFSASVVRAVIMGSMMLDSLFFFRKNDMLTSISFSLLLILLENPYKILDRGLVLSYLATIGIIYFSKTKVKETNNKIVSYLKELIKMTIYVNIFVLPIMIYNFNTISLVFVISNLIAGILIGTITIAGFILAIILIINAKWAYIIVVPYNAILELLINITKGISLIPFSQIIVPTPSVFLVVLYYLFLSTFILYRFLKEKYYNRYLIKIIIDYINIIIKKLKKNIKNIFIFCICILVLIILTSKIIPNNLKINFIDVGQGDSTLIITPTNKKILIDSGGAETENFDGGKNTLLPYLLDRKIIYLDYVCISHFDADHCKNFIYVLNNIKVKNIIISKQYESTETFEEIIRIAKKKNINILIVEAENIMQIEKNLRLRILWPGELCNNINKNSIVMKLEYNNFSCLFTGDISKEIERKLIKKYGEELKADILKVAHHGSNTSSDEAFIKVVRPQISLIGVGKNNKFNHPNDDTIKVLERFNSRIYRTDLMGEINIEVDLNGKMHKIGFLSK